MYQKPGIGYQSHDKNLGVAELLLSPSKFFVTCTVPRIGQSIYIRYVCSPSNVSQTHPTLDLQRSVDVPALNSKVQAFRSLY